MRQRRNAKVDLNYVHHIWSCFCISFIYFVVAFLLGWLKSPFKFFPWKSAPWNRTEHYFPTWLYPCTLRCASLVAQTVKNLAAMQETQVQSLGSEDALEKEMAIHSGILAWRTPRAEEPARLYSPWSCKELDMTEPLTHVTYPYVCDPSKLIFYKILNNLKLLTVELFIHSVHPFIILSIVG